MKKCPKCGTILDDSKTKCYMCGENLGIGGSTSFLDSVDANNDIGATISNNQDNVFNNGEDIEVLDLNEVAEPDNTQTFVSHSSSSRDYFSSEINQLNMGNNSGGVVDNYNPFAMDQPQPMPEPIPELPANNLPPADSLQQIQPLPPQPKKDKKEKKEKKEKKVKQPKEHKPIPKAMIFNSTCFIIFMVLIIFAYFKFIRKPTNEDVHLRNLTYSIDPRFEARKNESEPTTNYYKYGEDCIVRIEYGFSSDTESPEKQYLKSVEEEFKNSINKNITLANSTMEIKGNKWTTLNVYLFQQGQASDLEQEQSKLLYKYSAILHNGSLYTIQYYNPEAEKTCESMYQSFEQTLKLD